MTTQEPVIAGSPPVPVRAQVRVPTPASDATAAAVTPAPGAVTPAFRCPALFGNGVDMRLAEFTLVVEKDCVDGVDQLRAVVEVFGFFSQPGEEHDDDLLQTGCLAAPPGSLVARMACEISALPDAAARIESILRANIAACPCTAASECPAVSEARLLEAIEDAAGSLPPAGPPPSVPGPVG